MNIEQLETFLVLSEAGNFTKTAEILNVTQPAVSARINNLEAELNCKLFVLRGRKLLLSEAGELFLPYVKNILTQLMEAKSKIQQLQRQKIIVGFPPNFTNQFISRILTLSKQADVVPSVYRGIDSNDLVDQICKDAITMAFIHGRVARAYLHVEKVAQVGLVLLVGKHHHLANLPKITKEQLRNETLVCYKRNTKIWLNIERELQDIPLERIEVNDVETVKTLVKNGFGFTILPELSVDGSEMAFYRASPFKTTRSWDNNLYVVYHAKLLKNGSIHSHIQHVVQILRTSLPILSNRAV